MKTIFGHAALDNYEMTPIYSVLFDKEGKYIISGADDGYALLAHFYSIIKIWERDSMTLQASLHGHQDVITDVDISKCNKYLASSSKDGVVFIWDFEKCTLIDKLPTHNSAVNNIKFFQFKLNKDKNLNNQKSAQI